MKQQWLYDDYYSPQRLPCDYWGIHKLLVAAAADVCRSWASSGELALPQRAPRPFWAASTPDVRRLLCPRRPGLGATDKHRVAKFYHVVRYFVASTVIATANSAGDQAGAFTIYAYDLTWRALKDTHLPAIGHRTTFQTGLYG